MPFDPAATFEVEEQQASGFNPSAPFEIEPPSPSLRPSIPEPGEVPLFHGVVEQRPTQAFPALESRTEANIAAKTPELTGEEAEAILLTPQVHLPNPVPKSMPITRGVVNVAKSVPEFLTAPGAGPIGVAQLIPGVREVVDAVMGAGMVKAGAQMSGEASVTGDRQQMTEGVLGGVLGAAALAAPHVAPMIADRIAASRVGRPDLAAIDIEVRARMKPRPVTGEPIQLSPEQAALLPKTAAAVEQTGERIPSASKVEEAAEVHGPLLRASQEGESAPAVPVQESQPGVRPKESVTKEPSSPPPSGRAEVPNQPQPQEPAAAGKVEPAAAAPEIVGMGGAVPEEFVPTSQTATSIKNATVERERAARGLPPAFQPARRSFGQVWDEAMARIDREGPELQNKLIDKLRQAPRALTDLEDALLLHRQIDLQNEYGKATRDLAQAFDDARMEDVAAEKLRVQGLSDRLLDLYNINKAAGTETGRGLNARKMLAAEDFTLVKMEMDMRNAGGGKPLTDVERVDMTRRFEEFQKINKELEAKLAERDVKIREEQEARALAELKAAEAKKPTIPPEIKRIVDIVRKEIKRGADESREFLRGATFSLSPEVLYHLARVGADNLLTLGEAGAKWSAKMIADIGERVQPHLDTILEAARKLIDESAVKSAGGDKKRAKVAATAVAEAVNVRADTVERIAAKVAEGDVASVGGLIRKLSRHYVGEGIREWSPLVDAVYEAVHPIAPEMTKREVMDAISGYGKFKQLSKDEISVVERDLRGQMQQIAKLQDMAAGIAPKKTGIEQRTKSDKERQLIKEVNEAKKRGGFVVTDPATQLRTALQAVQRRLENQIKDLEQEIRTRERIVRDRKSLEYDDATKALVARRDALKKEHEAVFGKRELSDEQRLSMAMGAVERSIAEYEKKLAAGDISPIKRISRTPQTPELAAAKARRDALRAQLEELRTLAKPTRTPEELALAAMKQRTARKIEELTERMAAGDFTPRKPVEYKLDQEARDLDFRLEQVKKEWNKKLLEKKLSEERTPQKIIRAGGEIINTWRAIRTSIDFSAVLRQGKFVGIAHPKLVRQSFPEMIKAFKSEQGAFDIQRAIEKRDNYRSGLYKRAGLYLAEEGGSLTKMEEAYMSRYAEKIWGVAGSQRAYVAYLNKMRADTFDLLVETLGRSGEVTLPEAKVLANYVNVATGRGSLGQANQMAVGLNTWFFAPRYVASRFQMAIGQPLLHGVRTKDIGFKEAARARKLVAKEYGKILMGYAAIYTLAGLAGWKIGTEITSSDFGKFVIGDTRVDPLAGLSQVTVFVSRLGTRTMTSLSGKQRPLTGKDRPYGAAGIPEVILNFARSKLAPLPATALDLWSGENVARQPVSYEPLDLFFDYIGPISFSDIRESMTENGMPVGIALQILNMLGESVQTYEDRR